ncbi:MAG: prephenate dehydratase domain-containing protein, partial [Oscillospiraceae bacterium]
MDLLKVRNVIDEIDDQLHSLIIKRMKLSTEVAKCKLEENLPVFHPKREQEIIKRLKELSPKPYQDSVYNIYCQILSESKALQSQLISQWSDSNKKELSEEGTDVTIACQGVVGSYSSIAAKRLFQNAELTFCEDFNNVFEKVLSGECSFGIVPIENTCAGSVTDNYDLLLKYDVSIVRTLALQVNHCLLAKKGTDITKLTKVYSHPQALSQCSEFFTRHEEI